MQSQSSYHELGWELLLLLSLPTERRQLLLPRLIPSAPLFARATSTSSLSNEAYSFSRGAFIPVLSGTPGQEMTAATGPAMCRPVTRCCTHNEVKDDTAGLSLQTSIRPRS